MSVSIYFRDSKDSKEKIVLVIAEELRKLLGERLVLVEKTDLPDGSNLRVVIKNLKREDIRKTIEVIYEISRREKVQDILPHIEDSNYWYATLEEKTIDVPDFIIYEIKKRLETAFGERLVSVEKANLPDGSNLRVVIKNLKEEDIRKAIEIALRVADSKGFKNLIVDVEGL